MCQPPRKRLFTEARSHHASQSLSTPTKSQERVCCSMQRQLFVNPQRRPGAITRITAPTWPHGAKCPGPANCKLKTQRGLVCQITANSHRAVGFTPLPEKPAKTLKQSAAPLYQPSLTRHCLNPTGLRKLGVCVQCVEAQIHYSLALSALQERLPPLTYTSPRKLCESIVSITKFSLCPPRTRKMSNN